jgi:hypothetical protein
LEIDRGGGGSILAVRTRERLTEDEQESEQAKKRESERESKYLTHELNLLTKHVNLPIA